MSLPSGVRGGFCTMIVKNCQGRCLNFDPLTAFNCSVAVERFGTGRSVLASLPTSLSTMQRLTMSLPTRSIAYSGRLERVSGSTSPCPFCKKHPLLAVMRKEYPVQLPVESHCCRSGSRSSTSTTGRVGRNSTVTSSKSFGNGGSVAVGAVVVETFAVDNAPDADFTFAAGGRKLGRP